MVSYLFLSVIWCFATQVTTLWSLFGYIGGVCDHTTAPCHDVAHELAKAAEDERRPRAECVEEHAAKHREKGAEVSRGVGGEWCACSRFDETRRLTDGLKVMQFQEV